jgi:hypothetical protein
VAVVEKPMTLEQQRARGLTSVFKRDDERLFSRQMKRPLDPKEKVHRHIIHILPHRFLSNF